MSISLRVLLVEDSEDDAILVLRELKRGGYDVTYERVDTPESMRDALDCREWDVILSDYSMPRFSMPAALAMVTERGLDLPFIIVSGAIGEEAAVSAMRGGAHDYVMKNDLARLAPTVERALREAEARCEAARMQQALRDSEELYSALVRNISDAVFLLRGNTIAWCNDKVNEVYGYTRDELLGQKASLLYPRNVDPAAFAQEITPTIAAMEERGTFHGTSEFQRRDGITSFIEYSLSKIPDRHPVEIIGVVRDVTKRKRAEDALQESETHYRLLADNAMDIIATLDLNLSLTYISPSLTHKLGFTVEEAMVCRHEDMLPPESIEIVQQAITQEMGAENGRQADATRSRTLEMEMYHKDGSTIWSEVEGTFLRDKDGQVVGILAVVRDISERKRAEEQRTRLEQQLQLAGRLAAVGELAAGVAHELNNPLAAVQAFAQLLNDNDDLDSSVRKDVSTIYREAQRATRITTNLLRFARRDKPEKRLISLNEILEKSLELHAYQMKVSNIELLVDLAPELPLTMADADQIHQVFVNLITNASQAMIEAGGPGRLRVSTQKRGEIIQVLFEDTGPGIREENMAGIFDPFFTTKEVGKGTGLGLSICYGIVQEHGGQIYARSQGADGATFVVEIPVSTDDSTLPPETGAVQLPRPTDSPSRRN